MKPAFSPLQDRLSTKSDSGRQRFFDLYLTAARWPLNMFPRVRIVVCPATKRVIQPAHVYSRAPYPSSSGSRIWCHSTNMMPLRKQGVLFPHRLPLSRLHAIAFLQA